MKHRMIVILSFTIGLGCGWLACLNLSPKTAPTGEVGEPPPRIRQDRFRPLPSPSDQAAAASARAFKALKPEAREVWMKGLALEEIGPLLAQLVAQTGPRGMDSLTQVQMNQLLDRWAGEDFDGAWTWVAACTNPGLSNYVKARLLEALVETDPDRAFDLDVLAFGQDPDYRSSVAGRVMAGRANRGAAELLALVQRLPTGRGTSFMPVEYPEGFDFKTLLDGLLVYER